MRARWYVTVAAVALLSLVARPMGEVSFAQGEYSLLQGAIDLHLHIDPDTPVGNVDAIEIAGMKRAQAQGLRDS